MLENMALQENEENSLVSVATRPVRVQIARIISTVFSPVTVSLPAIILIALYHQQSSSFFFAALALFFASVGPMLYILVGVSLGKFTDLDVSVRSQRTGPFLFGIGSSIIGFFILLFNNAPKTLQTALLAVILIGLILMLTTFWWKISIHASALSGVITIVAVLYGKIIWPAFLLVLLVGWSRVVLKRHTPAQVTAGALITMALTLAIFMLRGY